MIMTVAEIKQLSPNDKITLMEQIWVSFQYNDEEIPSPDWHTPVIEKRMASIATGTAEYINIDSLRA